MTYLPALRCVCTLALLLALVACGDDDGPSGPGAGTLVAFTGSAAGNADIYTINADGTNLKRLTTDATIESSPQWSPNGSKILFESIRNGSDFDLFVMNADGSEPTAITDAPTDDHQASWSPDGSRIVFISNRDGDPEIHVMNANGTNVTQLTTNTANEQHPRFSPNGQKIVFSTDRDGPDYEIYSMNIDGGAVARLTTKAGDDSWPDYSRDGTRILFDDGNEIYVMNANGTNLIRITTPDTFYDEHPRWSPNNSRILFQSLRGSTPWNVYIMNADGSGTRRLVESLTETEHPAWHP